MQLSLMATIFLIQYIVLRSSVNYMYVNNIVMNCKFPGTYLCIKLDVTSGYSAWQKLSG